MNLHRMHETKKFSADKENYSDTKAELVTSKFVPQFSSSGRKRPITYSDEPHRGQVERRLQMSEGADEKESQCH